ncbi:Phosphomethylethanolamine N-methyltransferase [Orchesella cincta]|uniref:phosphoethanolamine N-methyltransferase n=1 Tax=Orchesella cincta TaxID=48709 RepID=A0A1D2M0P0_ORCCI|nr:Phosphomethylethanolamine N-methyltransferase [Orchesella cincta]
MQVMMLCSAANDILAAEDRAQVLKISPCLKNKRVLELGSGIGRFTTELAKLAKKVTAVDFIESYVEKNREVNGHFKNVSFEAADVMELELTDNSDEEVEKLTVKMLGWLSDGGYLFIRESCYRPSGDVKRTTNPTYYRSPIDYFKISQNKIYNTKWRQPFSFVCQRALSIEAYIKFA